MLLIESGRSIGGEASDTLRPRRGFGRVLQDRGGHRGFAGEKKGPPGAIQLEEHESPSDSKQLLVD